MTTTTPPKVGQKVFLPELGLEGEIVQFYSESGDLIQRVRVLISGKPTLIETTFLIVETVQDLAVLARLGVSIWGKIRSAATAICRTFGRCKPAPAPPEAVLKELARLEALQDVQSIAKSKTLRDFIAQTYKD